MPRIAAPLAALVACSAFAMAALPAAAQERPAPRSDDYRVRIGDLNLSTPDGAARLDQRIQREARNACVGAPGLAGLQCRRTLSRELRDALPPRQREEYARARSVRILAMVPNYPA